MATHPPPAVSRLKSYIADNSHILDVGTQKTILNLVMMEVGRSYKNAKQETVHVVLATKSSTAILLDNIQSEELLRQIYNIVKNRHAVMNTPAQR